MQWEIIATHGNHAWRQLLFCLSAIILSYAWVVSTTEEVGAWISLGFGFAYLSNGLFFLQQWPHSQWVKLSILCLFIGWLVFAFHYDQILSPIWIAPLVLMISLSFEIGLMVLSFFTLALIAISSWDNQWPNQLYAWQYIGLCLLMIVLAAHRNQWRTTLMPLLHFNVDQNIYYASYLNAYLDREIHRCEREGTGLVIAALLIDVRDKKHSNTHFSDFYPKLQSSIRPFDGLFKYQHGLIMVLPYFTAHEALAFCQNALDQLSVKAYIGISRYNLDQNPSHLIERAWLSAKTAEDQQKPWKLDDDQP